MWQLVATAVAAAAVVVIAVGVVRSSSDDVTPGEQPPAASTISPAPVESEPVGTATPSSTTTTSGLTEAEAVAAARTAAPQTANQPLLSAHSGPAGELLVPAEAYAIEPPLPPDRLVWKLVFGSGSGFDAEGSIVVIDALDASVYAIIDWLS
jgi:hypothetical protein